MKELVLLFGRSRELAPKLALALVAVLATGLALAQSVPAGTVADIEERTRPFGKLCLAGEACGGVPAASPPPAATGRSGKEIYQDFCHLCHATGLNDAPKFRDAEAWAPRLAKGAEAMLKITKEGVNAMPMMGACMNCTDAELQAAIDHMIVTPAE